MSAKTDGVSASRMARVWDATATKGPREHIFGGRKWRFLPDEPTEIPVEIARLVAHIAEFTVIGPDGEQYKAVPAEPTTGKPGLRNDQVVASLDELTLQALKARAQEWADHPEHNPTAGKPEVIKFLMARLSDVKPAAVPERAAAEDVDVDFDPESDGVVGGLSMAEIGQKYRESVAA
jgi:hypothetical protein